MKFVRVLFSIILLLVVVGALALGSLFYFMDADKLKPVIAQQVKKQTGYILVMDGKLSWSLYPHLGIKVKEMTLTRPNQTHPEIDLYGVNMATDLLSLLRGDSTLKGNVYIEQARVANLKAQQVKATLNWQNNVLLIKPLTAKLYSGSVSGYVQTKSLSSIPQWEWALDFKQVQLKPLLDDVAGGGRRLKIIGNGNVLFKGTTQGKTREQMITHLNGSSEFSLNDGILDGVDVNYWIQTADALAHKKPIDSFVDTKQTVFESLTGSAIIRNGVVITNNLIATSKAFATKGQGNLGLLNEALNLQLQVRSQDVLHTQAEVPLLVMGTLAKPEVRLDTTQIEKVIAKKQVEKLKTRAAELIDKHLPGDQAKILKGLLGQ